MPEYLKFRCCMCPNIHDPENRICPPGPLKPHETPCRFVKNYIDKRGWKYRVQTGIGDPTQYKARFQKPEKHGEDGWHCVAALPWRETFDQAQADLNAYAEQKGWREI
jgi:hypothetical protein